VAEGKVFGRQRTPDQMAAHSWATNAYGFFLFFRSCGEGDRPNARISRPLNDESAQVFSIARGVIRRFIARKPNSSTARLPGFFGAAERCRSKRMPDKGFFTKRVPRSHCRSLLAGISGNVFDDVSGTPLAQRH